MLEWLKQKAAQAAARQSKFNIKLNTQTLASVASKAQAGIDATGGEVSQSDVKRVHSAQIRLLDDIKLGLANGLSLDEVKQVIADALVTETINKGATMAIEHVLNSLDG